MIEQAELGWMGQHPHYWVPPLLLAIFFAGLLLRKALWQKRPPKTGEPGRAEEAPVPQEIPPPAAPETQAILAGAPEPAPAEALPPPPPPPVEEKPATFSSGLGKTRSGWLSKLSGFFSRGALGEEAYEQLEEILLSSDVGPKTTAALLTRLRERVKAEKISETAALKGILKEELLAILRKSTAKGTLPPEGKPLIVMVTGVNGAGKTTSIGKLAWRFAKEGKNVLLGAADTFRAAAMEQLGIWAERTGAQIVTGRAGADPGAVAFDAIKAGEARNCQIVLIDTAGRLHTKSGLMEELTKVKRVMGKAFAGAPHEVWLVVDANTGQNAIAQAREFNEALGLTGLVVAKLDGTAKGGAIFAIAQELSLPVRYVGVGEKAPDLLPFDPEAFVQALFEDD